MLWKVYLVVLSVGFSSTRSEECPPLYLRFSSEHSFCKPPNSTCQIIQKGVSAADAQLIVNIHNTYRNKVALGLEERAGGLPSASNMLQMVWDDQLAAVAQKTAEQCKFAHDCSGCREVRNFMVGQNLGSRSGSCMTPTCSESTAPKWPENLKLLYEEVAVFDKKYLNQVSFPPGKTFGHFTQMIWADTWRVGCGFVAYKANGGFKHLYVCNYGPKGNILRTPIYDQGQTCSSCPTNACCGSSCTPAEFPGLCKMLSDASPQKRQNQRYVFDCQFATMLGDCSTTFSGVKGWESVKTLGGSFSEIVLKGGETSSVIFQNPIKIGKPFCLMLKYRTGPTVGGENFSNKMVLSYKLPNKVNKMDLPSKPDTRDFFSFNIDMNLTHETSIEILCSVPPDAPPQYFNIRQVSAKEGRCNT